jgi:hypothetical protein
VQRLQQVAMHGMQSETSPGDGADGNYDVGRCQCGARMGACWHYVRCASSRLPNVSQPARGTNEDVLLQRGCGERPVQMSRQVRVRNLFQFAYKFPKIFTFLKF